MFIEGISRIFTIQRHGFGVHIDADGTKYIGFFKNNLRSGLGRSEKKTASKNIVFEGEWQFDRKNGYGKCVYTDGSYYSGQWVNNKVRSNNYFQM